MFTELQSSKGREDRLTYDQKKFMDKHFPQTKAASDHSALMSLCLKAKNAGDHFADSALAELENMTGQTFRFVEKVSPDFMGFDLVRLK